MSVNILNGKQLAQRLRMEMKDEVDQLVQDGIKPKLTVVLVGNNPASLSYVKGKEKAAKEAGILADVIRLPDSTSEKELLRLIQQLNEDDTVHGILVQLPLPEHIREQLVITAISPNKDVDGFHPVNIGKMMTGEDTFLPCTPYGIMTMLDAYDIEIEGKHAVVIGRSNIVGKPVGQLLLNRNATITYCHSRTKNLKQYTEQADILIAAIGKANVITKDYIKKGAVVIDVGINRLEDGSLTGDVDMEGAMEKASHITPVPGGVGPMTIAMLLKNTIDAAKGLNRVE